MMENCVRVCVWRGDGEGLHLSRASNLMKVLGSYFLLTKPSRDVHSVRKQCRLFSSSKPKPWQFWCHQASTCRHFLLLWSDSVKKQRSWVAAGEQVKTSKPTVLGDSLAASHTLQNRRLHRQRKEPAGRSCEDSDHLTGNVFFVVSTRCLCMQHCFMFSFTAEAFRCHIPTRHPFRHWTCCLLLFLSHRTFSVVVWVAISCRHLNNGDL